MINLGLSAQDRKTYETGLGKSHDVRVRVTILDRDEAIVSQLTASATDMLSGAVQVDAEQDVWRQLELTLSDPDERLELDPNSPRLGLFMDKFVAVEREDYIAGLSDYVPCPVFWGPLTNFERSGPQLMISALGKESLLLEPALQWETVEVPKGTKVTDAIRTILGAKGEARFSIPDESDKLPNTISVGPHDQPWRICRRLASSIDRELFYDGAGRARTRPYPADPGYVFLYGDAKAAVVDAPPNVRTQFDHVRNVIEVLGGTPKGSKKRIRYLAIADKAHPLSPWSLARNGKPRYLVEVFEESDILRMSKAEAIGERILADRLRADVHVEFDTMVIPHLEENDTVRLLGGGLDHVFRMRQFTIPLTSEPGSVGYTKRMLTRRRKR